MSTELQSDFSKNEQSELNRVVDEESSAYLCDAAEGRFLKAVEDGAIILINGFLLAKMYKKFAAVALESKEGFARGELYTLLDQHQKKEVRQAFDSGSNKISLNNDRWVHMTVFRMANIKELSDVPKAVLERLETRDDVLNFFEVAAAALPDRSIPIIDGVTRAEYRQQHKEGT